MIRLFFRTFTFFGLAAFMFLGPFFVQVLGKKSIYLRAWRMYYASGTGFYEVKYRLRTPQGEIPIDRFKALGYSEPRKAPLWLRRISRKEDLGSINGTLCTKYGTEADIRLYARFATIKGWVPYAEGRKNICSSPP